MYDYLAIGALVTAATITATHFFFWDMRLSLAWRYTIGVACIGAGIVVASLLGATEPIPIFVSQAGAAGLTTALWHKWRESRGELPGEQQALINAGRLVERASDGTE